MQDVERYRRGNAETLTLTDRKTVDAGVSAEYPPMLVDDPSRARNCWRIALDERGVIAIRDEADFLAVRLVRNGEAETSRLCSYLRLIQHSDREDGARKLFLGQ